MCDLQHFYYSRFGKTKQYQYVKMDTRRKYRRWVRLQQQKKVQEIRLSKQLERKANRSVGSSSAENSNSSGEGSCSVGIAMDNSSDATETDTNKDFSFIEL